MSLVGVGENGCESRIWGMERKDEFGKKGEGKTIGDLCCSRHIAFNFGLWKQVLSLSSATSLQRRR